MYHVLFVINDGEEVEYVLESENKSEAIQMATEMLLSEDTIISSDCWI